MDGQEVLVQSSVEWLGAKEGQNLVLKTNTRNNRYVFFGTATPISIMIMGSHQQDPEKRRRTFYRKPPGGEEEFWYLDPGLANTPLRVGSSTMTNFNLLNRVKLVEQEQDANM